MWALKNQTPFAAGKTWGRDSQGVHQWIVAVRATLDIQHDGQLTLAEEQLPPLLAPEYFGEPGESSLKYEADLIACKPGTDILVNGTAYAPRGQASTEFAAGLQMAGRRKLLRVLGERLWERGLAGLRPSAPRPVTAVPIRYELAYGGWDRSNPNPARQTWEPTNPVGRGVFASGQDKEGSALHQLELLQSDAGSGPAGLGAIDSFWDPRRALFGTYDKHWQAQRHPLLPLDWQPRALHCAPVDQQTEKPLRGGERIELFNLTPEGQLAFELPRLHFGLTTQIHGRREEHRAQLASVIIEPDQRRLSMVWNSVLLCHNEGDYLDHTLIRLKRYEA